MSRRMGRGRVCLQGGWCAVYDVTLTARGFSYVVPRSFIKLQPLVTLLSQRQLGSWVSTLTPNE